MTEEEIGRMVVRIIGDSTQYQQTLKGAGAETSATARGIDRETEKIRDSWKDTEKESSLIMRGITGGLGAMGSAVIGVTAEVADFLKQVVATTVGILLAEGAIKATSLAIEGTVKGIGLLEKGLYAAADAVDETVVYMIGLTEEGDKAREKNIALAGSVRELTEAYQDHIMVLGDVAHEQKERQLIASSQASKEELQNLYAVEAQWFRVKDAIANARDELEKWKAGERPTSDKPNQVGGWMDSIFGGPTFGQEFSKQFEMEQSETAKNYAREQEEKIQKELERARAIREVNEALREQVEEEKRLARENLSNTPTGDNYTNAVLPGALEERDRRHAEAMDELAFATRMLGVAENEAAKATRDRELAQQGFTKEQREARIAQEEFLKDSAEYAQGQKDAANADTERAQALQKVLEALREQRQLAGMTPRERELKELLPNGTESERAELAKELDARDKQKMEQDEHARRSAEYGAGQQAAAESAAQFGNSTQERINTLKEEIKQLDMDADAKERYKSATEGATEAQLKELEALQKTIKLHKEKEEATKAAKEMLEEFATPQEKFIKSLQEVTKLKEELGQDFDKVYSAVLKEAKENLQDELKIDVKFETHGIQALKAGSAEAEAAIESYREKAREQEKFNQEVRDLEAKSQVKDEEKENPAAPRRTPIAKEGEGFFGDWASSGKESPASLLERIATAVEAWGDKELVEVEEVDLV